MAWGNPVIGIRNPIAPPLTIQHAADGRMFTDFHLGAAFEGPPGHVHGGVSALILDHVLGEVAPARESALDRHHHLALPADDAAGATYTPRRASRTEGIKTFAAGHLADEEGVTVEAEGVFIQPKWARD